MMNDLFYTDTHDYIYSDLSSEVSENSDFESELDHLQEVEKEEESQEEEKLDQEIVQRLDELYQLEARISSLRNSEDYSLEKIGEIFVQLCLNKWKYVVFGKTDDKNDKTDLLISQFKTKCGKRVGDLELCLDRLDSVDSQGNQSVRRKRKEVVLLCKDAISEADDLFNSITEQMKSLEHILVSTKRKNSKRQVEERAPQENEAVEENVVVEEEGEQQQEDYSECEQEEHNDNHDNDEPKLDYTISERQQVYYIDVPVPSHLSLRNMLISAPENRRDGANLKVQVLEYPEPLYFAVDPSVLSHVTYELLPSNTRGFNVLRLSVPRRGRRQQRRRLNPNQREQRMRTQQYHPFYNHQRRVPFYF